MGQTYTVQQGDYLAKIAKVHGFANWRNIYDHPDNAEFKQKRPNPNIIKPGDKIVIPDKTEQQMICETEKKHRFKMKSEKIEIDLELKDTSGEPLYIAKYELKTKGEKEKTYTKTIEDNQNELENGCVREKISTDEEEGVLKIWLDDEDDEPDYEYQLKLGQLDPIDETTGVQARLNNLGYECGAVDDYLGPKTEQAIKTLQEEYGLKMDGIAGEKTLKKIEQLHKS